jgi:hypothetical protein
MKRRDALKILCAVAFLSVAPCPLASPRKLVPLAVRIVDRSPLLVGINVKGAKTEVLCCTVITRIGDRVPVVYGEFIYGERESDCEGIPDLAIIEYDDGTLKLEALKTGEAFKAALHG